MNILDALHSLCPGSEWSLRGDDLIWHDTKQTQPTQAEIDAEIARLQAEHDSKAYARARAEAYAPIADQLDRKSTRLNSQSHSDLVCRLLLEKKKKQKKKT